MFALIQRTQCTASGTFLVCHSSVIVAAWKNFQGLTLSLYVLLICKYVGFNLSLLNFTCWCTSVSWTRSTKTYPTTLQTFVLSNKSSATLFKRREEKEERKVREELEKDREPSRSPGFRTRWTLLQNLASRHPHWCQGPPALSWVSSCRG